jgi:hypothetical protein
MRRKPLALLSILGAGYAYLLIRQMGKVLAATALGMPVDPGMIYGFLPDFQVSYPGDAPTYGHAILMLAGPGLALLTGYFFLWVVWHHRERIPSGLRLLTGLISYLGLILDPAYYALIPLLRLGGEPEILARATGVSPIAIVLPAMVVLGLNVMLAKRHLIPAIRGYRDRYMP